MRCGADSHGGYPRERPNRPREPGGNARSLLTGMIALLVLTASPWARAQAPGDRATQPNRPGFVETIDEAADESAARPWADGVPGDTRREVYVIFLEGNDLMREALFAKGAAKYRAALTRWDHPAFHYNLGVAQMNLDQIIEAYHSFERSLRHGPVPIGQDKYDQAQHYLTVLRNQLAEIEVICEDPGASVALDGNLLFTAPGRKVILVRPGGHRVEASNAQRLPDTRQVVVNPGDHQRVTLVPQLPESLTTVRRWPRWIPWAALGASTVVLASGAALDWHSSILFDAYDLEFDEKCAWEEGCQDTPELRDQLGRAELEQWLARGIYVAGGLTLATGTALLYLNRERLIRRQGPVEAPPSSISLRPLFAPRGAGVSVRVRF